MSYEAQLKYKEKLVADNLTRIGGISDFEMYPVIGMETPFNYRNKAQFPVGLDKNGRIVMGFYAGRTHYIIENTDCRLGAEINKQILELVREYMQECNVTPYDENSNSGIVRHVLIRMGFHTKQIMTCLIINADKLPKQDRLVDKLKNIPGMTSVMVNVNKQKTNVILGKHCETLWGKPYIEDSICGIMYQISPLSFFQVNPVQTEKLYQKALEYAELTGNETVWDLYCGIGTISLFLAKNAKKVYGVEIVPQAIEDARNNAKQLTGNETVWDLYCGIGTISLFLAKNAKKVYGVEIVPQAIEDARNNAKRNNITNAEFFVGKAEEVVPAFYNDMKKKAAAGDLQALSSITPDVVVVDPPRKGCEQTLLDTIITASPKRIVYVSCDASTLARDLKYLAENGYKVVKVQPVDQFAHTVHVETVCLIIPEN